jgi:hypothetical protein
MFLTILNLLFQGICVGFFANPMLGAMKQAGNQAGTTAAGYGSEATGEEQQLNPFLHNEMEATHGLTAGQVNEELTAGNAGSGGALGTMGSMINSNAARTGNATGAGKTLDEMARDRGQAAAKTSEGVAAQDVGLAKQENQQGAAGMQGLYGTNVGAQLGAMKQQSSDISAAAAMDPSAMQDMSGIISDASQAATAAAPWAKMASGG